MGVCSFFIVKLRIFVVFQIISAICNAHPHLTADGKLQHPREIPSELDTDLEQRFITPIEAEEDNINEVDDTDSVDDRDLPFLSEIKHVKDTFIQPVKMGNIVLLSKVNVEKEAYEKPDSSGSSEEEPEYLYRKETVSELSKQPLRLRNLADTSVPRQSGDEYEHRFHRVSDVYNQPVKLGNLNVLSKVNAMQQTNNEKSSSEESESRSEPDSLSDADIGLRSRDSGSPQDKISDADDQPMRSRFDEEIPDTRHRLGWVSDVYKQPVKLGNLAILSKLNTVQDDSSLEESESQPEPDSLSDEEDEEQYNYRFLIRPRIFSESINENLVKENDLISNNEDSPKKKSHVLVSSRIFTGSEKPVELKNIALLSKVNQKVHEITVEPADEEDDTPNARIPFVQEDMHPEAEDNDASVSVRRIHVYYPPVEFDASNSTNQDLSLQARILSDEGSTDPKSIDFSDDKAKINSINQHDQIPLDTRRLSRPLLDMQDVYEQPVQMGNLALLSKINTKGSHKHRPKSRKSHRKSKSKNGKLKKFKEQKSIGKRNKKHHHKHSHKHAHRKPAEEKIRLTKHTGQKQNNLLAAESQNANHGHSYTHAKQNSKIVNTKDSLENQDDYFSENFGSTKQSKLSTSHRKNSKTYSSQESSKQQQEQHYFGSKVGQTNQAAFSGDHRQNSNAHNTQNSSEERQEYLLSSNLGGIKQDVSSTRNSAEQQHDYFAKDIESMQQIHSTQSSREQQQDYSGKYIGNHGQDSKVHPIHDSREHHLNYFEGNVGTLKQDQSSDNNLQNSKVHSFQDSREQRQNYWIKDVGSKEKDLSTNDFLKNSALESQDQQKVYFIKDVGSTKHDLLANNHRQNFKLHNAEDSREQRHHYFGNYAGNTEQNLLASNNQKNCKACEEEQTMLVNNIGNAKQGVLAVSYEQSSKADSTLDSHKQQKLYFIKDVESNLSAGDVGRLKLIQTSNEHQGDEKFAESNTASEGSGKLKVSSVGDGRRPLMQMDEEAAGKSEAFVKAEVHGLGTANAHAQAQASAQAQVHAQGQPEALPVLPGMDNKQSNAIAVSEQHVAEDVLVKDSKQSSDAATGLDSLDLKGSQQLKSDLEVSLPKERSRFQHPHMNSEENGYYIEEEAQKSVESSEERESRFLPWRRRHYPRPQNFIYRPRFKNRPRYHKHGRGRGRPQYWVRHSPSLRRNEENESKQELDSEEKMQDLSSDSPVSSRIEHNYAEVRRKSDKASDAVSSRMLSPQYHQEEFKKSFAQRSDVRSTGSGYLTANSREKYQFLSDDSGSRILQAVSPLHTEGPNPMLHFLYSRILPHDWKKVNSFREGMPVNARVSHNSTVVRQSVEGAPGRVHLHVTNDNTRKVDDKTFSTNMHVDVDGNKEDEGSILSNLKDILYKIQKFILSADIESESNNSSRTSSELDQQDLRLSSSRSSVLKNPVRYYKISKKSHGKHGKPVVTAAAATKKLVKSGDKKEPQERMSDVPLRFLDKHNLAKFGGKGSDFSKESKNLETRTLDYENPNNQLYVWPSVNRSELDYIIEDRVATLRQFTYEFNRLVEDLSNFSLSFKSKTDIFGEAVRKSLLDFTNVRDMESIITDAQHLMDHLRQLIQNIINDVGATLQYLLTKPNYAIGEVMQNMSAGLVTLVGQLPRFVSKSIEWTQTRQLRSLQ